MKYEHNDEMLARIAKQLEDAKYKIKYGKLKPNGEKSLIRINARRNNMIIWVCDRYTQLWKIYPDARKESLGHDYFKTFLVISGTASPSGVAIKVIDVDKIECTVNKTITDAEKHLDNYRIIGKKYKRITNDFVPFKFGTSIVKTDDRVSTMKIVWLDALIERTWVEHVIGIDRNGRCDQQLAARPGETPWFFLVCQSQSGAQFAIISDGEKWYPVNRKTNKLTSVLKISQVDVDPSRMSGLDKMLVQAAIERYCN